MPWNLSYTFVHYIFRKTEGAIRVPTHDRHQARRQLGMRDENVRQDGVRPYRGTKTAGIKPRANDREGGALFRSGGDVDAPRQPRRQPLLFNCVSHQSRARPWWSPLQATKSWLGSRGRPSPSSINSPRLSKPATRSRGSASRRLGPGLGLDLARMLGTVSVAWPLLHAIAAHILSRARYPYNHDRAVLDDGRPTSGAVAFTGQRMARRIRRRPTPSACAGTSSPGRPRSLVAPTTRSARPSRNASPQARWSPFVMGGAGGNSDYGLSKA